MYARSARSAPPNLHAGMRRRRCSLPPRATRLSGCRYWRQRELRDGPAVFADPHDAGALAATVNALIDDEPQRLRFMASARQRADRYTVRGMTTAYLEVYRSMLRDE